MMDGSRRTSRCRPYLDSHLRLRVSTFSLSCEKLPLCRILSPLFNYTLSLIEQDALADHFLVAATCEGEIISALQLHLLPSIFPVHRPSSHLKYLPLSLHTPRPAYRSSATHHSIHTPLPSVRLPWLRYVKPFATANHSACVATKKPLGIVQWKLTDC